MRRRVSDLSIKHVSTEYTDEETSTNKFTCTQTKTVSYRPLVNCSYYTHHSDITDVGGGYIPVHQDSNRNPDYQVKHLPPSFSAKPCVHLSSGLSIGPTQVLYLRTVGNTGSCGKPGTQKNITLNLPGYVVYLSGLPSSYWSNLNAIFDGMVPYGSVAAEHEIDWQALYSDYDEQASSYLPSEVFLSETLAQPAIFIDTLRALVSPRKALLNFVKLAKNEFGDYYRSKSMGYVVRRLLKRSANANLLYSFGIKPAVSDIQGILGAHRTVGATISSMAANRGQFVPIRVRRVFGTAADQSLLPTSPTYIQLYLLSGERRTVATVGCRARIREDFAVSESWKAYLQYFGIGKVAQLAWELVPYSFVVDWVTGTQERINKLTRFGIGSPYAEFRNFCCSYKTTASNQILLGPGTAQPLGMYSPGGYIPLGEFYSTKYVRALSLPTESDRFSLSGLGLFHLGIGSSLLIQKKL